MSVPVRAERSSLSVYMLYSFILIIFVLLSFLLSSLSVSHRVTHVSAGYGQHTMEPFTKRAPLTSVAHTRLLQHAQPSLQLDMFPAYCCRTLAIL